MTKGCTCSAALRQWSVDAVCATCGHNVLEQQLAPGLIALLTGGTGLVLWQNPRGFDAERKVKYGLITGAADYVGLWRPTGRFVAIELKTPRGRQQPNQQQFQALVERTGGLYAIVRCDADARWVLDRLRAPVPQ